MAERSFPLENTLYTAEEASLWFAPRTSGVHASDVLGVTASDGLTVSVSAGMAWLKYADFAGVAYANTDVKRLSLSAASANYPRIDRIVVRYSKTENRVYLAVRSGVPASSPVAPNIVRDESTHEISLAQVRVNAGATSLDASHITDERTNNAVCGLMTDGVTPYIPEDEAADRFYRVGDIYITTNSKSPAEMFGGTWERIKDRFLLAAGDSYMAGSTGGEAEHELTEREMPSHDHLERYAEQGNNAADSSFVPAGVKSYSSNVVTGYIKTWTTGGSQPHNNMPPYLAVYVWRRVA